MFEDSISCSPGNDKKSSRSRRFHKKTKQRSQKSLEQRQPCLELLYEESTQSIGNVPTQYEYFNPFESEIVLAAADIAGTTPSVSKLTSLVSQGFVKLEDIPVNEDSETSLPALSKNTSALAHEVQTILGPETQFGITESEFMRFCDEAEDEVTSQPMSNVDVKSKETKSIVDAILEDFCGSPFSESPPKLRDDSSPVFRFKSKSLRTYSGRRRKKPLRNIGSELANISLQERCGNASDSSDLSIQEDLSQTIVPQLDTVDLNNSIKVCENLLNLSSYFSQLTPGKKSPPEGDKNERLSVIVADILQIRRETWTISRDRSEDKFYGFSNSESPSKGDCLRELLEAEDDVLQQINCDSLCYERVAPKVSFSNDCSGIESVLEEVNAVIEETNNLMSLINGEDSRNESTKTDGQNCDNFKDVHQRSLHNSLRKDEQLFDEVDLWNDADCLLNYKTQKHSSNVKKSSDSNRCLFSTNNVQVTEICQNPIKAEKGKTLASFQGFSTASKKHITISEEAKLKAEEILTKFEQSERDLGKTANGIQVKTYSSNTQSISTESVQNPAEIRPTTEIRTEDNLSTMEHQRMNLLTRLELVDESSRVDFSSSKTIEISDKAKEKTDEILKQFEQKEEEGKEDKMSNKLEATSFKSVQRKFKAENDTSNEKNQNVHFQSPSVKKAPDSAFAGFSTASMKPISISNEAKRRADEILKQFEQQEEEKKQENTLKEDSIQKHDDNLIRVVQSSTPTFQGFSTASRKPILISEEAKRKADDILKKFHQNEKSENTLVMGDMSLSTSETLKRKEQELLMDMEFFEEAFEEELKTIENESSALLKDNHKENEFRLVRPKNYQPETVKKSNFSSGHILEGFKTASKKPIQVSELAKRHADKLLREVEKDDLPQDFLKCIEADIEEVNPETCNVNISSIEKVEQVDGASKNFIHQKQKSYRKENLHDNNVLPTSTKPFNSTRKEIGSNFPTHATNTSKFDEELTDDVYSITQEYEIIESNNNLKRKRKTLCTEDLVSSSDLVSPRRASFTDRSPLNQIDNGILHKTSSMPQLKSTSKCGLISRKNLLSLSKRKKINSPTIPKIDEKAPKTPDKPQEMVNSRYNEIATPNLREFFDSVATSTPRLTRAYQKKAVTCISKAFSIDMDFRQISWEDANNSGHAVKTNSLADLNVTCSQVTPSPQQRIERLKMYGEPPPISPVLIINKCRPSGLRKRRSRIES